MLHVVSLRVPPDATSTFYGASPHWAAMRPFRCAGPMPRSLLPSLFGVPLKAIRPVLTARMLPPADGA